jgi:hypothetical protein
MYEDKTIYICTRFYPLSEVWRAWIAGQEVYFGEAATEVDAIEFLTRNSNATQWDWRDKITLLRQ